VGVYCSDDKVYKYAVSAEGLTLVAMEQLSGESEDIK
jgi:hypothetical protein